MSYTIEDIARIIGARRIGDRPAAIDWLLTDSRSLSFPEETLFFALPTKRNDGTRYIRDLYARGVRNFVVSEERLNEVGIREPKVEDAARQETVTDRVGLDKATAASPGHKSKIPCGCFL